LLAGDLPSSILLCERPQKAVQPPDVIVAERTIKLYDRTADVITLDEVERI
jgi:hypothetical protein